jgi:hypothetical protein
VVDGLNRRSVEPMALKNLRKNSSTST